MNHKQVISRLTFSLGVAAVFFLSVLISLALAGEAKLKISPDPAEFKKGVKVTIMGEGFKPKQEVGLWVMLGGVLSDVSFLTKPKPVADEQGKFKSVWQLKREFRRNLLLPGSHTIEARDKDGKTLAKAELVLKKK